MANEYLYGAYGRLGQTIARNAVQAGTVPVYVRSEERRVGKECRL